LRVIGERHERHAPLFTLHWKLSLPDPLPLKCTVALRLRAFNANAVIRVFGAADGRGAALNPAGLRNGIAPPGTTRWTEPVIC
jgi:hypothetical protein